MTRASVHDSAAMCLHAVCAHPSNQIPSTRLHLTRLTMSTFLPATERHLLLRNSLSVGVVNWSICTHNTIKTVKKKWPSRTGIIQPVRMLAIQSWHNASMREFFASWLGRSLTACIRALHNNNEHAFHGGSQNQIDSALLLCTTTNTPSTEGWNPTGSPSPLCATTTKTSSTEGVKDDSFCIPVLYNHKHAFHRRSEIRSVLHDHFVTTTDNR